MLHIYPQKLMDRVAVHRIATATLDTHSPSPAMLVLVVTSIAWLRGTKSSLAQAPELSGNSRMPGSGFNAK